MPGAQERILRRRIASTQNMKKITRAMELIAATRVVKAQMAANDARPYSEQITNVITNLAAGGTAVSHPLLRQAEDVRKVGVVVLTSDRGLAGAYNSTVIRAAERVIQAAKDEGKGYSLVTIGRKAEGYFKFRNYHIDASFSGMSDKPTYEDAREIAAKVTELFANDVDEIELAYTRFITMGNQQAVVRRFLPLDTEHVETQESSGPKAEVEFEPSPASVLESLLPRYVESRLFAALLDAAASEHAARQRAMKAATDNAQELIVKLARKMNQARQDAITTEIMEIIGGAEALSADKGSPEDLLLDHLDTDPFPKRVGAHQAHDHSHL
ncbi:MAG TPA: F0F1 ATP synthase subunit gamma [Microthrixaceae bacterium]|nr:F0F1 ATP synthase subunit gamma [Microthrixaceae bacterium]HNI35800.1 F0F1 ATP synthase subunit gamma [Microthrixaceae bacterium]